MTEHQETQLTLATPKDVEPLMTMSAKAKADAASITVDSEEMLEIANSMVSETHKTLKTIEARREEITRPLNNAKASAIAMFRPMEEALTEAKSMLGAKIVNYRKVIEQKRRAEEERQRAEIDAEKQAAALALEQALKEVGDGVVEPEKIVAKLEQAETRAAVAALAMPTAYTAAPATGGNAMVGDWKVEVTDLPAFLEYLAADLRTGTPRFGNTVRTQDVKVSELKAFAKSTNGEKAIPGVTFTKTDGLRVRA